MAAVSGSATYRVLTNAQHCGARRGNFHHLRAMPTDKTATFSTMMSPIDYTESLHTMTTYFAAIVGCPF